MARRQQDREDLLHEATALVERAELAVEGYDDPVVIGFRVNWAGCIYLGADPVYQFNSERELRRGYYQGKLIKAEHRRLVSLDRQYAGGQVQMRRREFTDPGTKLYLDALQGHIARLQNAIGQGRYKLIEQVPAGADVMARIQAWLESLTGEIQIAKSPHVM